MTVQVGLDGRTITALVQQSIPVPPPLSAQGLIDTGTNVTCVAGQILRTLGVTPFQRLTSMTVGGPVSAFLYEVSLTAFGSQGAAGPALVLDRLVVMELTQTIPDVDVLIGMDVLWGCKLLLDGPARQFSLEF